MPEFHNIWRLFGSTDILIQTSLQSIQILQFHDSEKHCRNLCILKNNRFSLKNDRKMTTAN